MKMTINTAYNAAVDCITAERSQKKFAELPLSAPSFPKSVNKLKIARANKKINSSL